MADLSSARHKLKRAKLHTEAAHALVRQAIAANIYAVILDVDGKGRPVVKVSELRELPADFALLVGDAAHNLRSALDHIVYALAKPPLSPDEERSLQFPLTSKRETWRKHWRSWLPRVPVKARTLINGFQPYRRKKPRDNMLLAQLQTINNWDKHRRLSIVGTHVKRSNLTIEIGEGGARTTKQINYSGPIKKGTVIAKLDVADASKGARMKMTGKLVVIPVFGERSQKEVFGLSVINRLNRISTYIEGVVIPKFEALGGRAS
jgi:hypothetical protein